MVSLAEVRESNSRISQVFGPGLVAVFVGGTNGMGYYTLRKFAEHTSSPRIYFIGRSQKAGDRIRNECLELNPGATVTFIPADVGLIKNVDKVCQDIKAKEKAINLLFLSTGTLDFQTDTSEGLRLAAALIHHSRCRFIYNFLPELRQATSLKRVVNVFAGTKEGPFWLDDINAEGAPFAKKRGHAASLVTLGMETYALQAPDVSFIHDFPGRVKSGIARDMPGFVGVIVRLLSTVTLPLRSIPEEECGAYHLFFATSARFPPAQATSLTSGVPLGGNVTVAQGNQLIEGGGMYCIDERGESGDSNVAAQLAALRREDMVSKINSYTEAEWKRILSGSNHTTAATN